MHVGLHQGFQRKVSISPAITPPQHEQQPPNTNCSMESLWTYPTQQLPGRFFFFIVGLGLMISQQGTWVWYWNLRGKVIYVEVQSSATMPNVRGIFYLFFWTNIVCT